MQIKAGYVVELRNIPNKYSKIGKIVDVLYTEDDDGADEDGKPIIRYIVSGYIVNLKCGKDYVPLIISEEDIVKVISTNEE